MGGLCSVCGSGQEERKVGAWEDLSGGWTARDPVIRGIPMTIHVPDVKRGEQLTRRRIVPRYRYSSAREEDSDDDDNDDDCADDEREEGFDEEESMADLSKSDGGSLHDVQNGSADLLLSDSDCDESDRELDEGDDEEDDLDDDDEEDDDANLLGESLFPTDREEDDGDDDVADELLLQSSHKDQQPLIILSTLLTVNQETTDPMLQFYPDKESRLMKPSFVEQYNCLGTVL